MKQEAQWPINIRIEYNLPDNHGKVIKTRWHRVKPIRLEILESLAIPTVIKY